MKTSNSGKIKENQKMPTDRDLESGPMCRFGYREKGILTDLREIALLERFCCSILALVLLCVSTAALAQGNSPQISDKELAAFAKAYAEVQKIRAQYEPSLQKTKDSKASERLQQEANAKLKKTLDKQGLSVDRYNKIYAAVNANEDLRRKALKMVEQERKKS
ncbi:MAG: DUF4168 domain-containing protein [Deltaproteobacteria bacterium]